MDTLIHHFSDVHFEINGYDLKFLRNMPGGDVLIMNGDIHCAKYFKENANDATARSAKRGMLRLGEKLFSQYKKVIHVMGNHEHYGGVIEDSASIFREFYKSQRFYNVHVLENDVIEHNDIVFVCATLWTDCNKRNPLDMYNVNKGMNDYYTILSVEDFRQIQIEDTIKIHEHSRDFIFDTVAKYKDKTVIVATHHAPSRKSEPNRSTAISAGYYSDLDELIYMNPQIKFWIHGHTHNNVFYNIGETKVTTAMYGYEFYERTKETPFLLGSITIKD